MDLATARVFVESLCGTPPASPPAAPSFDALALAGLTVVSADATSLTCALPLDRARTNRYGTLHGGAASTLVDVVSSAAFVARGGESGVSVHLSVDFLRPAPLAAASVTIKATVRSVGRTLATADVEISTPDGKVVAIGRHIKHVGAGGGASARPVAKL